MLSWLGQNIGWLLVLLGLAAVVAGIVVGMVRERCAGKGCTGNCAGCAGCCYAKSCPSRQESKKK